MKILQKNRTKNMAKKRQQKAILSKKPTMAIDALLMRFKRLTWFCGMVVLKNGDLKKLSNDGPYRGAKMTL